MAEKLLPTLVARAANAQRRGWRSADLQSQICKMRSAEVKALSESRRMRYGVPKGFGSQMSDNPCCNYTPDPDRPLNFMYQRTSDHIGAGVDHGRSGHTAALRSKLAASSRQLHTERLKTQHVDSLHWRTERGRSQYTNEAQANPGFLSDSAVKSSPAAAPKPAFEARTEHFAYETSANIIGAQRPLASGSFARKPRTLHFSSSFIGGSRMPRDRGLRSTADRNAASDQLLMQRSGGEGVWRSGETTFMMQ